MRLRPIACTAALALMLGACAAANSDSITRACDDYATVLQLLAPLKPSLGAKVGRVIDTANLLIGPACAFGPAGAHYSAAVAGWAAGAAPDGQARG